MKFTSALVSGASGSLRGMTASHNKGGQYLRGRTIPTNPASSFQQAVRNNLSVLQTRFLSVLNPAQRAGWATYAENTPTTDSLGNSIKLSANNWYIGCNSLRLQASVALVDAPPTTFGLITQTAPVGTITAAGTTGSFVFANTDSWAIATGGYMLIFASRPQNATINFFKGPYRFAAKITGAGTPPTSPAVITLPFPSGPTGSKQFFRSVVIGADGRRSIDIFLVSTV